MVTPEHAKISTGHLERRAIVYLRQSTLKQLHEHQESTARQYALKERAMLLGWESAQVDVIDEDLGVSGSSATWRPGFQRIAAQVAHGKAGAIFALEVSRLARSSADWHRLVELCALADVVICDEQCVYAPQDYNDRLLLGLKGTMSEAEQYWMRLRLQGGCINKARRGAYHFTPTIGYEWDSKLGCFVLDPDEQVQRAIDLVFERFRVEGSAYRVHRYFLCHGLKLPSRHIGTRELRWVHPHHGRILRILKHPLYTGAYVYGRSEERMGLADGEIKRRQKKQLAQAEWKVCLPNQHPGYISWEEFMSNQKKLSDNRTWRATETSHGAAREGSALLQGVVLCGRCGRRMRVRYRGKKQLGRYECRPADDRRTVCYFVHADEVDHAVSDLLLQAVNPSEVELSLAVSQHVTKQASEVDEQWQLQLERAQYKAQLCERRYKAVDPDNRVVVRTLERDWNEALVEVEQIELQREQTRREKKLQLTATDRAQILALSRDLSKIWDAPTTSAQDRKNLLRTVIAEVSLSPIDVPARGTRVQVLWQSGAVSDFTVARPNRTEARRTPKVAIELVGRLSAEGRRDEAIADQLNQDGIPTTTGRSWSIAEVRRIRSTHLFGSDPPLRHTAPARNADGLYSLRGVAERVGVPLQQVQYWVRSGKLNPQIRGCPGRPHWIQMDDATLAYLQQLKLQKKNQIPSFHAASAESERGHYA